MKRMVQLFGIVLMILGLQANAQEAKVQSFAAELEMTDAAVTAQNSWISTTNGVFKLNQQGAIETHYTKHFNGFPMNHTQTVMAAETGGGSWVGTYAAGIVRIKDSSVQQIKKLNRAIDDTFTYAMGKIPGTDKIGVLTANAYHVYDEAQNTVKSSTLPTAPFFTGGWKEAYFKPITDSTFWFSGGHRFFRFDGQSYQKQSMAANINPYQDIALAYDEQGRLWATSEDKMFYYENDQWHFVDTQELNLSSKILCMNKDLSGKLHVASENQIVYRDNGQWKQKMKLEAGFWDDKENWLLGIGGNDQFLLPNKDRNQLISFDGKQTANTDLKDNGLGQILGIAAGGQNIWIASDRPLGFHQLKEGKLDPIPLPDKPEFNRTSVGYKSMTTINNQGFWLLLDSSVVRYQNGQWEFFQGQADGLPEYFPYNARLKNEDGELLLWSDRHLYKFADGRFEVMHEIEASTQATLRFFELMDEGIVCFDYVSKRLKIFQNGNVNTFSGEWHKGELGEEFPYFIENGPKGGLWISNTNHDLARYKDGNWTFPDNFNQQGQTIKQFQLLDSNNIMMGTNQGFLKVNAQQEIEATFNMENTGLPYNEAFQLRTTDDGRMVSFGDNPFSDRYLTVLDLEEEQQSTTVGEGSNLAEKPIFYPNPAKDQLYINFSQSEEGNNRYQIRNLSGQTVEKGHLKNKDASIDLKGLKPGVYFITLQKQTEQVTQKLIVH